MKKPIPVNEIVVGDALTIMRGWPDESVHCVVTSPPYFGLRSYEVEPSIWGGDQTHVHEWGDEIPGSNRGGSGTPTDKNGRGENYGRSAARGNFCACGSWRGSLGLEPTAQMFVAHLVLIFREVRRILRPDGTVFINIGDSFASANSGPSRFPSSMHVPACDNDGTERTDSWNPDSVCSCLCDGCLIAGQFERRQNTCQLHVPGRPRGATKVHDSEHSDCDSRDPDDVAPFVPASTMRVSSRLFRDECSHCANCGVCLEVLRSASRDARLCVRRAECIGGISATWSECDTRGKDASGMAWFNYNIKPKDLMLVPFRLAIALQEDGWYVRNDLIWDKSEQCMPESTRDRCTRAHEFIFHLAKSQRYYYDMEAVREPCVSGFSDIAKMAEQRTRLGGKSLATDDPLLKASAKTNIRRKRGVGDAAAGRNMRTVWRLGKTGTRMEWGEVQHFATFPEELPKRCILAGTSEYGCCADCGAPWERIVGEPEPTGDPGSGNKERKIASDGDRSRLNTHMGSSIPRKPATRQTLGWRPTCECHGTIKREEYVDLVPEVDDDGDPTGEVEEVTRSRTVYLPRTQLADHPRAKAIILDPFMGSGTTAFVAAQLNRNFLGVEMNPAYAALARKRVDAELRQIKLI